MSTIAGHESEAPNYVREPQPSGGQNSTRRVVPKAVAIALVVMAVGVVRRVSGRRYRAKAAAPRNRATSFNRGTINRGTINRGTKRTSWLSAAIHALTALLHSPERHERTAGETSARANIDHASGPRPPLRAPEPTASDSKFDRKSPASWTQLVKEAVSDWLEDKAPRLGAALAYYTVFSIAPLLVIALAVAGRVFGDEAAKSQIDEQLAGLLGAEGAAAVQSMIAAANKPQAGAIASIIGGIALVFGASGVFGQMKDALNSIWEVEPKPGRGIWGVIRDRFLTFAMVLGIVFLMLVTLLVSATLAALTSSVTDYLPGPDVLANALDVAVSLGVVTLLFALIFKYLPDAEIAWKDVWLGAAVTAVLFTIGKYAIGLYLGTAGVGSAYGAAGSIVIVLLWAYYSSQILFFGAELTQAYARMYGSQIKPAPDAVAVTAEKRAEQGLARPKHG
jgi:membrane protein